MVAPYPPLFEAEIHRHRTFHEHSGFGSAGARLPQAGLAGDFTVLPRFVLCGSKGAMPRQFAERNSQSHGRRQIKKHCSL